MHDFYQIELYHALAMLDLPNALADWVKGAVILASEVKFLPLGDCPSDVALVMRGQCLKMAKLQNL
jgi:hypothetical protein